ncbi:MAG: CDP-diacylglycerol--serine O-phosphatidyltransferase [Elusimicrobiota bacterium]
MNIKKASILVPSLFTVANMGLGFFAIFCAIEERWIAAPTAIFIGHIMDIFDGRIARAMGTASKFGGEFDSFADWMSFGIAPAIMIYLMALKEFGDLGLLLSFFFILCGAIRLTRFNLKGSAEGTGTDAGPSLHFTGLPIPGAGGFLAVLVLLFGLYESDHQGRTLSIIHNQVPTLKAAIPVIVFGLSFLMVSKIQYSTFKKTKLFHPRSLKTFLITLFALFMIYSYPQNTIFILYVSYICWGIVITGFRYYKMKVAPKEASL